GCGYKVGLVRSAWLFSDTHSAFCAAFSAKSLVSASGTRRLMRLRARSVVYTRPGRSAWPSTLRSPSSRSSDAAVKLQVSRPASLISSDVRLTLAIASTMLPLGTASASAKPIVRGSRYAPSRSDFPENVHGRLAQVPPDTDET